MSSNSKTLEVITANAYPDSGRGYKGKFTLPLTYDVNITNELTSRMKSVGPNNELIMTNSHSLIEQITDIE